MPLVCKLCQNLDKCDKILITLEVKMIERYIIALEELKVEIVQYENLEDVEHLCSIQLIEIEIQSKTNYLNILKLQVEGN